MNRSEKFNFYLPQNIDPIDVSNFDYNFEIIDENLITAEQELTSTQKANARANLDLGSAALQTVVNNLTRTSSGAVLDARQGKALNDKATANGSAVSAIENSLAIVSVGNTHGAITSGQYVYIREHSSLAEGLYTANSNISANATLSTSNVTSVSNGGLNVLSSLIASNKQWTRVNSSTVSGKTAIYLPSEWSEVMATVFWSDNPMVSVSAVFPYEALDTKRRWIGGCYTSASDNHVVQIDFTRSAVNLECWKTNGTDKTSGTTIRVYVR